MPASEAQIRANRANSLRSTGPSAAGKERSRANALKHGLTGAGVVLPEADAAEVDRKAAAYARELGARDEVGADLARTAALSFVRMDRSADRQAAALAERVNQVEADFVPPEGASPEEAAQLLDRACRIAMFDPSKEAALARRYEAAAERNYFRALKELRQHVKKTSGADATAEAARLRKQAAELASFLPAMMPAPAPARPAVAAPPKPAPKSAPLPVKTVLPAWEPVFGGSVDVPITIGRAR